jgi:hypothetical protein
MKLGIVAVYTGGPDDAALLDLHLRRIEKAAGVPYTLYAGAKRLAPENRRLLAGRACVDLSDCPSTRIRGSEDHALALEPLIRRAVDRGSTHVCVLHMDSFPVRRGWESRMEDLLESGAAFVTVARIGTACLFFSRDFYVRHAPALLVTGDERSDPVYRRYVREVMPLDHSGIGYGYRAFAKGLGWHSLPLSPPGESCGELYGGMIFHLGGAVRVGHGRARIPGGRAYVSALASVSRAMRRFAGERRWRDGVGKIQRTRMSAVKEVLVERPRLEHARRRLLEDTESFLRDLLKGAGDENAPGGPGTRFSGRTAGPEGVRPGDGNGVSDGKG